jgi:hypothetical protein
MEIAKAKSRGKPFAKGNPGKPKGAISHRLQLWEALGAYVVNEGAERAMEVLATLDDETFLEQYMKMLEYFKPKQARVTHAGDAEAPVQIIVPPNL